MSQHLSPFLGVALVLMSEGCFEISLNDHADEDEPGRDAGSGHDGGDLAGGNADAAVLDADGPEAAPSAPDASLDAGATDEVRDAGPDAALAARKHTACLVAPPDPLPAEPTTDSAPDSAYYEWQSLSCPAPDFLLRCDAELPCPVYPSSCVRPDPDQPGFCSEASDDTLGAGPWIGSPGGRAGASVTSEEKRAACCLGIVDCSPERKKGPGEDCVKHADCEPGLLCKVADWPYGLCLCPDVEAETLEIASSASFIPPRSWGAPATAREVGSCKPATAPGWVDEVVYAGEIGAMAAAANGQEVHVLTGSELGTQHWTRADDGSWSEQAFTDKKANSLALAFDAAGNLRAAFCARNELFFVADAIIPMNDDCMSVNLALAGDGQAALAYYVLGSGTKVARQAGAEWTTRLASDLLLGGRPSLTFDGQGTLHVVNEPLIHVAIGNGEPQVEDLGYGTEPRLGGVGAAQPVLVWSTPSDSTVQFMRLNEEPASPTQVWVKTDPRVADEPPHPRVTYGPDGKPWIVHHAPEGLNLLREGESGWQSTPLVPELPPLPDWFELVFDGSGAPHLLYVVEPGTTIDQELRHAYQGSCKTP